MTKVNDAVEHMRAGKARYQIVLTITDKGATRDLLLVWQRR
jgi:hypothetical protein